MTDKVISNRPRYFFYKKREKGLRGSWLVKDTIVCSGCSRANKLTSGLGKLPYTEVSLPRPRYKENDLALVPGMFFRIAEPRALYASKSSKPTLSSPILATDEELNQPLQSFL